MAKTRRFIVGSIGSCPWNVNKPIDRCRHVLHAPGGLAVNQRRVYQLYRLERTPSRRDIYNQVRVPPKLLVDTDSPCCSHNCQGYSNEASNKTFSTRPQRSRRTSSRLRIL